MPLTEINVDLIDEGEMLRQLEDSLRYVAREVVKSFEHHSDAKLAKGEVKLTIGIAKEPDLENCYLVGYTVSEKLPKKPDGRTSLVTPDASGALCCQKEGGSARNPNQESFLRPEDGKNAE